MKIKLISAAVIALAASSLHAQTETYQFEATYTNASASSSQSTTLDGNQFSGTYYFKPVAINTGAPQFEAEFLQRASNVNVTYAQNTYEDANIASTSLDIPQLSGKLYLNDFILGVQTNSLNKDLPLKAGGTIGLNATTNKIGRAHV